MRAWGADHDLDAGLLHEVLLLRGRGAVVDPRGVRVGGPLDLDLVDAQVALRLPDCLLEHGASAVQAYLPMWGLDRCRLFASDDLPALDLWRLHLDGQLGLRHSVITAVDEEGGVRLVDARIGGHLNLRGVTVRNSRGPALAAGRMQPDSAAFLDEGIVGLPAARLMVDQVGEVAAQYA
jgi:hypothetical protein